MKLYWFNDTSTTQYVYGPTFETLIAVVAPQTGVAIKMAEGQTDDNRPAFIKQWDNGSVLISDMDPDEFERSYKQERK